MKIKVFLTCSESKIPELDYELDLLDSLLYGWFHRGCFEDCGIEVLFGDCHETQKEKACNKSVCKQRRNKTVNASKSS